MCDPETLEFAFLFTLRKLRKSNFNNVYQSLSAAEFYTLFAILHLREQDGTENAPVRVGALVEELQLSPQAVSKMLRTLEQKGYCQRITDPQNRRNTLVVATDSGAKLAQAAQQKTFQFAQLVTERMGKENMETFVGLARRCADVMQEVSRDLYAKKEELS